MTVMIMMTIIFCVGMAALFFAALTGEQDYRAKMKIRDTARARSPHNVHYLSARAH